MLYILKIQSLNFISLHNSSSNISKGLKLMRTTLRYMFITFKEIRKKHNIKSIYSPP